MSSFQILPLSLSLSLSLSRCLSLSRSLSLISLSRSLALSGSLAVTLFLSPSPSPPLSLSLSLSPSFTLSPSRSLFLSMPAARPPLSVRPMTATVRKQTEPPPPPHHHPPPSPCNGGIYSSRQCPGLGRRLTQLRASHGDSENLSARPAAAPRPGATRPRRLHRSVPT